MTKKRGAQLLSALLVPMLFMGVLPAHARRTVAQKKQIARTQFEEAERLREALKGKPEKSRTRRDYNRAIEAFRRVYTIAPTSNKAAESALTVGDLMVDYGRAFDENKSFENAIKQYEFLRREYPGSRQRFEALFTIAQIYREDLDDQDKAKETFEEFLHRYSGNDLAEQARDALKDMAEEAKAAKSGRKKVVVKKEPPAEVKKPHGRDTRATQTSEEEEDETPITAASAAAQPFSGQVSPRKGRLPLLTSIRHWSTPDYTRIAIDLEEEVKYEAGRVPSPDRIFFDLHDTKLASELVGKTFDVGDGFLRKIRVAQYSATLTRVVLEVDDVAEYSAFLLPNPYRLIIDIHGKQQAKIAIADANPAAPAGKNADSAKTSNSTTNAKSSDSAKPDSSKPVVVAKAEPDATKELTEADSALNKAIRRDDKKEVKATAEPTSAPTVEVVAPRKASGKSSKHSKEESAAIHEAQPTANGDRSLIRALGLKIGKIVVDAGHGGHDTGTIGPNGLQEKDLVLDVALRLGKLLESKLGAEVVYTRDDDTFIPLESRTAIANKNQADLFISVHANSSHDPKARGVETYYLNFTSNSEALEVAARENAVSQKSVFELQDLVKKIALKDKIDESREFATDVQKALFAGFAAKGGMRDRGVKKAPFVVLIGANMPSILAEISFVSNPSDEKKLQTPEYRQKIADSLYRGVYRYASGLSGVRAAGKLAEAVPVNPTP